MLSAKHRLRKKKEIDKVFKNGRSFKEGCLILKTMKNDLAFCRFAFVVSKKVSSKAVVRNKIRRKIREAVRLNWQDCQPGTDNLFIVLPALAKEENLAKAEENVLNLLNLSQAKQNV